MTSRQEHTTELRHIQKSHPCLKVLYAGDGDDAGAGYGSGADNGYTLCFQCMCVNVDTCIYV